ncbi:MAG: YceD family protein [Adlercreutzia equolifaciens]
MATDATAIIAIPEALLETAATRHFEGTLDLAELAAGPDTYIFAAPVSWSVEATNTGDAILVQGTAAGDATTQCARCLEDVTYGLEGDIEGYFLIGGEEEAETPEDMEGDEFDFLPDNRKIDLVPLIVAALLLEVPLVPLCDDDCKGLCPQCGANLNEGPCGCSATRRTWRRAVRGPQELRLWRQVEDPVHNGFSTKGGAAETLRRPSGYECERSSKVVPYGSDAWERGGMR